MKTRTKYIYYTIIGEYAILLDSRLKKLFVIDKNDNCVLKFDDVDNLRLLRLCLEYLHFMLNFEKYELN